MNKPTITLRDPQPGDMGWVVQQHGEVFWREYRWDMRFEALVASIVAGYVTNYQSEFEKCWIAEVNGVPAGSAFVVRKSPRSTTTAQLRMLILSPEARGLGLGGKLTDECISFAREKGYKKMTLWTNACLLAPRAIYVKRGFKLVKADPYQGFGHDLVGETWELKL